MQRKVWKAVLSKHGSPFDECRFYTLEEAIRWSEQLRFEDNYLISIFKGNEKEPSVQYISTRDNKTLDCTTNLFSAFR